MEIISLKLKGTFELRPRIIEDKRGVFAEIFKKSELPAEMSEIDWVQENQSTSKLINTVRGLHLQKPPFAQSKLIRVPYGEILDVFVDLRKDSATYGKWDKVIISAEAANSVFIPRGFAHGFRTLRENTVVQYLVDNMYSVESELGFIWNDSDLGIDWGISEAALSDKDAKLTKFSDFETPFC